jgi:hypothetical protein
MANEAVPNFTIADTAGTGKVDVFASHGAAINLVIDEFGYFTSVPVVPTYTVTPTTATTVASGATQAYTVSGLGDGATANIALFPSSGSNAPSVASNGSLSFTPTSSTAATSDAAGEGTTNNGEASISVVNGVPTTGNVEYGVTASATGTVNFSVTSNAVDGTIPVVYTVPSSVTSATPALVVNTNGSVATGYGAGLGGSTTWSAPAAAAGTYSDYIVQSVDATAGTFEAQSATTAADYYTFTYNGAGDSYNYPDPAIAISETQFASFISGVTTGVNGTTVPGDELATISYNPSGPSSFVYGGAGTNGDVPAAPTALTVAAGTSGGEALSWTAPPNLDVTDSGGASSLYTVYEAPVTSGAVGTYASIGTVAAAGASAATSFTAPTPSGGPGTYSFVVTATAGTAGGGKMGPPSNAVTYTVTAAATAPISTSTSTSSSSGVALATGDVFVANFNQPVTLTNTSANPWSLTLTDGKNTTTLNPTNSTAVLSSSGTTVTYTITSTPTGSPALPNTANLEVLSQNGVADSVGPWNLAGSTATANAPDNRVFAGTNAALPAAPTDVSSSVSGNSVTATCGAYATSINVYTAQGALLGTGACSAPGAATAGTATASGLSPVLTAGEALLVTDMDGGVGSAPTAGTTYESVAASAATGNAIAVTPATSSIGVGGTETLTATVTNASGDVAGDSVTFASSDKSICTVTSPATTSSTGTATTTVTGVADGSCTVTATDSTGGSGSATVTVTTLTPSITGATDATADSIVVTYNETVTCASTGTAYGDYSFTPTGGTASIATACSSTGDTITLTDTNTAAEAGTLSYTAPTTNSVTASTYAGTTSAPAYAASSTGTTVS